MSRTRYHETASQACLSGRHSDTLAATLRRSGSWAEECVQQLESVWAVRLEGSGLCGMARRRRPAALLYGSGATAAVAVAAMVATAVAAAEATATLLL
eukprot:4690969-Prymnesium_polylepis.1